MQHPNGEPLHPNPNPFSWSPAEVSIHWVASWTFHWEWQGKCEGQSHNLNCTQKNMLWHCDTVSFWDGRNEQSPNFCSSTFNLPLLCSPFLFGMMIPTIPQAFWDLTVAARDCVDGETTNSWLPEASGKWLCFSTQTAIVHLHTRK